MHMQTLNSMLEVVENNQKGTEKKSIKSSFKLIFNALHKQKALGFIHFSSTTRSSKYSCIVRRPTIEKPQNFVSVKRNKSVLQESSSANDIRNRAFPYPKLSMKVKNLP